MVIPVRSFQSITLWLLLCGLSILPAPSAALAELPDSRGPIPECEARTLRQKWKQNQSYTIEYPQCGLKRIDKVLRRHAEEYVSRLREEYADLMKDPDSRDDLFSNEITYALFAPSSRYVSVVFQNWDNRSGMPHGRPYHYAMTFEKKTGKIIQLADVFQDWGKAEKALPDLMRAAYAAKGCDPADIAQELVFEGFSGDDRDPFHLEPNGLALYFDFFAIHRWDCSPVVIPKEKLLDIGADPKFWQP